MKRRIFFSILSFIFLTFCGGDVIAGNKALTLKSAVEIGILRNRDVIIEKYLHKMALERILEAKGNTFDPILSSNLEVMRGEIPIAEIFYSSGLYTDHATRGGIGVKGKVFTGASYGVDFYLESYKTTSQVVTLSPRYSSRIEFSLIQPLLKEFGESITKTKIRIAETETKATQSDVKDKTVRTVHLVEEAYWNLVFSTKNLDLKKEGLNLARRLVSDTEIKIKAGELAPISLIEVKSGMASMEEDVISAENDMKKSEYDLKLLLGIPEEEDSILPVDQPKEMERMPVLAEELDLAQKNRADIQAAKIRAERKKIEEKYYQNQLLPRLDVIGKYGRRGLSGEPSPVIVISGGQPQPVGNRIIGTPFEGKDSLWDSIEDFIPHQGFDYWSVGLKLEIPLGNREAQSRYRQSRLEGMKMETEVKSLDEKISNEVIKGILDIKTTVKMKEAAKTTVDYTGESLKVEEKRYLAGESTGYDVMKIQKDLSEAKTRYLKAQVENNKAWSRLRAAEGVSLDEYEIEFNDKMM